MRLSKTILILVSVLTFLVPIPNHSGVLASFQEPPLILAIALGNITNYSYGDLWAWTGLGQPLRRLTNWGYNFSPTVSPDGKWVAYSSLSQFMVQQLKGPDTLPTQLGAANIWLLNIVTNEAIKLVDQPTDATLDASNQLTAMTTRSAPVWSPDSKILAWTETTWDPNAGLDETKVEVQLVVYDIQHRTAKSILHVPVWENGNTAPAWGKMGIALTVPSDAPGTPSDAFEVRVLAPDGKVLFKAPSSLGIGNLWVNDNTVEYLLTSRPDSTAQYLTDISSGVNLDLPDQSTSEYMESFELYAPSGPKSVAAYRIVPPKGNSIGNWKPPDWSEKIGYVNGIADGRPTLAFSPDGQMAAFTVDHRLFIYNHGQIVQDDSQGQGSIFSMAWGLTGTRLRHKLSQTEAELPTLIMPTVHTNPAVQIPYPKLILVGHTDRVNSVAFSPDGKSALTGSSDNTARLWELGSGQILQTFSGHTGPVNSVAFSPDGKTALTGGDDKTARLWDAANGHLLRTFSGHTDKVFAVAFSPDGKTVLTGSADATAILWDTQTGTQKVVLAGRNGNLNYSVAFSPDGKTVATAGENHTTQLWDSQTGNIVHSLLLENSWYSASGVTFTPDGRGVLTSNIDKTVRLWDLQSGTHIRVYGLLEDPSYGEFTSVTISRDGKYILVGDSDGTAKLWDFMEPSNIR